MDYRIQGPHNNTSYGTGRRTECHLEVHIRAAFEASHQQLLRWYVSRLRQHYKGVEAFHKSKLESPQWLQC